LVVVRAQPFGSIVWRKGDRWRIDACRHAPQVPPAMRGAKPPDDLGWNDPFIQNLGIFWVGPSYICDGRAVYKNATRGPSSRLPAQWELSPGRITPRSLLSGEGLGNVGGGTPHVNFAALVYPDLTPFYGWSFQFDPKPADAPGCMLIKRSAEIGNGRTGNEWYYIDPAKGCAVARVELFNLPPGAKVDPKSTSQRDTIRMEDFQLSPQGFWYPSVIRGQPFAQSEVHYHFDFDPVLPDNLFNVDLGKK
ncbi:MAG: hypothetical protein ABSG53_08480, partial [Thermoguttaceae bacterium]